jgi:hypothetical protein
VSEIHRDRVAVVINGNAKDVTRELVDVLDQIIASGDLFVTRSLEEGREIALEIVSRGYQTVLTGGGDGTFSQMVTAVVHGCHDQGRPLPRFGLLRLGTGNALAWVLGAQKHHRGVVADLARLRREGGHRNLRLLEVEGTLAPFAGVGVDALALRHFNEVRDVIAKIPVLGRYGRGRFSYFVAIAGRTLPEVLVRSHAHMRVINEGEDAYRVGGQRAARGPAHPARRDGLRGPGARGHVFLHSLLGLRVAHLPVRGRPGRPLQPADREPRVHGCGAAHPQHLERDLPHTAAGGLPGGRRAHRER